MTAQPSPDPLSPALREEIEREATNMIGVIRQRPVMPDLERNAAIAALERIARAAVSEERERCRQVALTIAQSENEWRAYRALAQPGSDAPPEGRER